MFGFTIIKERDYYSLHQNALDLQREVHELTDKLYNPAEIHIKEAIERPVERPAGYLSERRGENRITDFFLRCGGSNGN